MRTRLWVICLAAPIAAPAPPAHALPPPYTVRDIGVLADLDCEGAEIRPEAINEHSQIVGWARTGECFIHAFLWDPATGIHDLGTLQGGDGSAGFGLNTHAHAVGGGASDTGYRAFYWTPDEKGGGEMRPFANPAFSDSSAAAMNDAGQTVGWTGVTRRAALWPAGPDSAPIDLGLLPGTATSVAASINNAGVVVGTASDAAISCEHAFIWDAAGGLRPLPSLGGPCSAAHDINAAGQAVGAAELTGGAGFRAVLWDPGSAAQSLGLLLGDSAAYAINDTGHVVGASPTTGDSRAFLWTPDTGTLDLNTLIPATPGIDSLAAAYDINNRAQIVAVAHDGARERAVLLTPRCPADWNADALITSDDVFSFLTNFFDNNADFDSDGATDSDDYFAFLTAFFEGC